MVKGACQLQEVLCTRSWWHEAILGSLNFNRVLVVYFDFLLVEVIVGSRHSGRWEGESCHVRDQSRVAHKGQANCSCLISCICFVLF